MVFSPPGPSVDSCFASSATRGKKKKTSTAATPTTARKSANDVIDTACRLGFFQFHLALFVSLGIAVFENILYLFIFRLSPAAPSKKDDIEKDVGPSSIFPCTATTIPGKNASVKNSVVKTIRLKTGCSSIPRGSFRSSCSTNIGGGLRSSFHSAEGGFYDDAGSDTAPDAMPDTIDRIERNFVLDYCTRKVCNVQAQQAEPHPPHPHPYSMSTSRRTTRALSTLSTTYSDAPKDNPSTRRSSGDSDCHERNSYHPRLSSSDFKSPAETAENLILSPQQQQNLVAFKTKTRFKNILDVETSCKKNSVFSDTLLTVHSSFQTHWEFRFRQASLLPMGIFGVLVETFALVQRIVYVLVQASLGKVEVDEIARENLPQDGVVEDTPLAVKGDMPEKGKEQINCGNPSENPHGLNHFRRRFLATESGKKSAEAFNSASQTASQIVSHSSSVATSVWDTHSPRVFRFSRFSAHVFTGSLACVVGQDVAEKLRGILLEKILDPIEEFTTSSSKSKSESKQQQRKEEQQTAKKKKAACPRTIRTRHSDRTTAPLPTLQTPILHNNIRPRQSHEGVTMRTSRLSVQSVQSVLSVGSVNTEAVTEYEGGDFAADEGARDGAGVTKMTRETPTPTTVPNPLPNEEPTLDETTPENIPKLIISRGLGSQSQNSLAASELDADEKREDPDNISTNVGSSTSPVDSDLHYNAKYGIYFKV